MKITEAVFAARGLADRRAGGGAAARGGRVPALRAQGREGRRPVPPRAGREQLRRHVRGRRPQPRAPLQGDRVRVHPDRAREVHGPAAVPRLPRPAAAARRSWRSRVDGRSISEVAGLSVTRGAGLGGRAGGTGAPSASGRSPARCSRRSRRGSASWSTSGSDYLTLDRASRHLSGGEAQRIRLATQIGSRLVGVLYILDEPSIGLHQRDNAPPDRRRSRGCATSATPCSWSSTTRRPCAPPTGSSTWAPARASTAARSSPRAPLEAITGRPGLASPAQFLRGERAIAVPAERRASGNGKHAGGPRAPARTTSRTSTCASRSARSSASPASPARGKTHAGERDALPRAGASAVPGRASRPGAHDRIEGIEQLDKVIDIDQSPIGRTPRSNPATYTGVFDADPRALRQRARGQGPRLRRRAASASTSRAAAARPARATGIIKIEMQFLPDVYVPCEVCKGKRYNRETLEIHYKGKNIADVLDMTVEEALEFFDAHARDHAQAADPAATSAWATSTSASPPPRSPAARRSASSWPRSCPRRATGNTLYILDEPTTGLHFADVATLLDVLHRLVGRRQHGPRHRAQPGRDQDRRLDHRPRARRAAGAAARSSPRARRRRSPERPGRDGGVPRAGAPGRAAGPAQPRHVRRRGGTARPGRRDPDRARPGARPVTQAGGRHPVGR